MRTFKEWLHASTKEKKVGRGHKGWSAELHPVVNLVGQWELYIIDDLGQKWKPLGARGYWTVNARTEKEAIRIGRQKLIALADREIDKRTHAARKKIVL